MGDTATDVGAAGFHRRAHAGHREDRPDRHDRVRRAHQHELGRARWRRPHRGRVVASSAPSKRTSVTDDVVLPPDEVLLKADLAFALDGDPCLQRVLGDR